MLQLPQKQLPGNIAAPFKITRRDFVLKAVVFVSTIFKWEFGDTMIGSLNSETA